MPYKNTVLFSFILFVSCLLHAKGKISVEVDLYPAGDFVASSQSLSGKILKAKGKPYVKVPQSLKVAVETFKTGISLRDDHMYKHTKAKKHPYIMLDVDPKKVYSNGKHKVLLSFAGVKKEVEVDLKIQESELEAKFSIDFSKFGITDISYKGIGVEDEAKVTVVMPYN